jgi:hypothetical protein
MRIHRLPIDISSISRMRRLSPLLLILACAACTEREVTVDFYPGDGHELTRRERNAIQTIADATAVEVRHLLPALPKQLVLGVETGTKVIDETGETAVARSPNTVYWTVDASRTGGAAAIIEKQLRATLFHEFHHLVRDGHIERTTLLDAAVAEGLATAFERDQTGVPVPWGEYPENVSEWVTELMAVPATEDPRRWMFRHPDGRRWIAYKVGTYLVDRAVSASGKTPAELVVTSTRELVDLARSGSPRQGTHNPRRE